MIRSTLALFALLAVSALARPAAAQESHKFNAKTLEAKYAVPVFKGKVENNEVIEAVDDVTHLETGVYMVKADVKKVVDFYTKALGTPKKSTSDVGAETWTFRKDDATDKRLKHRVVLTHNPGGKLVQVTLWQRRYESAADADE